jgi:iron complex outermembrane recepter protein
VHTKMGQEPVAHAIVFLAERFQPVETDAHGRFRLEAVPAGSWTLIVQRDGYVEARQTLTVASGPALRVSVELEPAPTLTENVTVTASRHEESSDRVPATIGAVSGEEIRNMRPEHIAEPLNRIPGVHIVAFSDEGTHNSVRQPLCCRPTLLMMEDGIALTSPAFYSTSLIRQVNFAQSGRIEVLKGPGTAAYGSDGMTGVINFISADPPSGPQFEVSAEGGGAGFVRSMFSVGSRFGNQSLLATGNFSHRDGRRDDPRSRKSGGVRWDALTNGGVLFKTSVNVNRTNGTGSDDQTPEQFASRSRFNQYPIAFDNFTSVRASTSYEQQTGRTSWTITPFFRYQDVDFVPGWQLSYNPVVWYWGEKSGGVRTQVRRDITPMNARLSAGFDVDYTDGYRQEPRIDPVSVNGVWVNWSLNTLPPEYDYRFVYRGFAPYAQVEFTPTTRLRVTVGGRFDVATYDYTNRLGELQTGSFRRPHDANLTYKEPTPKFGATYALTSNLTLVGSYRRGFRVPPESNVFKQGRSLDTLGLQPIKNSAWEGGLRGSLGRRVRFDVTTYYMRLTDDILSYREPDGASAATNNGESLHRGVELQTGIALRRDLRVDLGYSYAVHTFATWSPSADLNLSGKEMDGAPRHQRSAQLTYTPSLLRGGRLQLEWLGMSAYWLDPANTLRQDGYNVFHLRASYMVARHYELFARVINLFDRLYAEQGFLGDQYAPRYLSPGEYRTVYAGISARF